MVEALKAKEANPFRWKFYKLQDTSRKLQPFIDTKNVYTILVLGLTNLRKVSRNSFNNKHLYGFDLCVWLWNLQMEVMFQIMVQLLVFLSAKKYIAYRKKHPCEII